MAKKAAAKKSEDSAPKTGAAVAAPPSDYVVMARRFRPGTFADVVGQAPTTNALKQALRTGRVAQAYLFCGPRGVGKTSLARIIAKALNCAKGEGPGGFAEEPCNACPACESIHDGSSLDVIEMDAATNRGIEEVRELRDSVGISPAELRFKVYIIDEVHMLTREAWNAFLKTLEEPPPRVKFIFATTDPNDVPETILSRCQRYDLRRINTKDIVGRLRQICETDKIQFEEAALSRIASLAKGGLRDAEGLLDQAVNLGEGKVADATVRDLSGAAPDELIFDLLHDCAAGNAGAALLKVHQALEAGADPEDMLAALCERLRGGLLCKTCGVDSALLEGQSHLKEQYVKLGTTFSEEQMLMLTQLFLQARRQLKDATQSRLPLEMAVVRASKAKDLIDLGKLASAIEHAPPGGRTAAPQASSGIAQSREGPRPNGPSRPAVAEPQRTAEIPTRTVTPENNVSAKPAPALVEATNNGESVNADDWQRVVAATAQQKGAGAVVGALKHAADVRIDAEAGTLMIGFTPDLLLYLDLLEKPQSRTLLAAAVEEALGRSLNLALVRVATATRAPLTSVPMARSTPPPARRPVAPTPQARPMPPPAMRGGGDEVEPDMIVGDADEEIDVDYTESGSLPMNSPATGARAEDIAPLQSGDDDDAPPPPTRAPVAPPAVRPSAYVASTVDISTVKDHPLVKMVLKETQGTIVNAKKR